MLPHILSKVLWNEELLPGSPENFQSIPTNPVLFWANVQLWVALQVDGELGGFGSRPPADPTPGTRLLRCPPTWGALRSQ